MEEMMKDTQAAQSAAQPTAGAQAEKKPRFSLPKGKKGKKWLKILIAVAVVAAIAVGCVANAAKKANSQIAGGYLVAQAVRQDLVLSVTGTATLKPADSYNVTTLLSGTIEDAPFEEDDQVEKGDLLFAMDSSDAQNRVIRHPSPCHRQRSPISRRLRRPIPPPPSAAPSMSCMSITATA